MSKETTSEVLDNIQASAKLLKDSINAMNAEQRETVWQVYKTLERIDQEIFL